MRTFQFAIKGVTFEGRQEKIAKLRGNEPVRAVPEPENPYDKNAIAIHVAHNGQIMHVGYMAKEHAADFAPFLDGESVQGRVVRITGGFEKWDGSRASLGLIVEFELPENPTEST